MVSFKCLNFAYPTAGIIFTGQERGMTGEPIKGLYIPTFYKYIVAILIKLQFLLIKLSEKTELAIWVLTLDSFSHINVLNGYAWLNSL